jgi:hypothetical protein
MRLHDCILDIDRVARGPLEIKRPKNDWVLARYDDAIPASLYELYTQADFLSFGCAPSFLADENNILFGYFSMLLRSIKELCLEAPEELTAFESAMGQSYDLGKKLRGEHWDRSADRRARRALKHFVVALAGTVDAVADLIALFFTCSIPNLQLGRAQFTRIETWLGKPLSRASMAESNQQRLLDELYEALRPIVVASGSDKDWLPLLRLIRNKSAHMGDRMFPFFGLHDANGTFYHFLPRRWPYILESRITKRDAPRKDSGTLGSHLEEILMHQDMISFAKRLRLRVLSIVDETCKILAAAYVQFKSLPVNESALRELNLSSESYSFEFFPETAR